MGWLAGADPAGESIASAESEPPRGVQYSGLGVSPMLRLGGPEVALRSATHRPRRPVVVDGAVWE
jgi:hypothetical protein